MAIEKKLIHFKKWSDFSSKKLSANEQNTQYTLGVEGAVTTGAPDILYQSICWIKDVKSMWTHGMLYDCSGGNVDLSQYVTDEELANATSEFITAEDVAKVATSGSYNDLTDKPTIPSAVTESTVSGWGFTKATGTYSKPSGGIPKSDLASDVQASLSNADNAVQKGMVGTLNIINVEGVYDDDYVYALPTAAAKNVDEDYDDIILSRGSVKTINGESIFGSGNITISGGSGTITGVSANGTSIATSGVANIPAASTSKYGVTKLSSATNSTSTTLAATPSAVKAAYDLAAGKASMSDVNTAITNAITNVINASY